MASPRDSPASEVPSENVLGTLSIRDKSLLKRNINRHHNNNLSAGYVPVHEEDLHKTGLRGRKTYLFWTVIAVICVLALANLILLLIMLSVLRIGLGMESLEIIPDQSIVKLYGKTDLGQIYKRDGLIEGYRDKPLVITADKSQLLLDIVSVERESRKRVMTLEEDQVLFDRVQSFQVKDPKSGKEIFSTKNPNFGLPNGVRHLHVDYATTPRVTSAVDENLVLRSDSYIRFKGNEGTRMEGKNILWSADQFLFLKSVNGSIILNGTKGVSIDMSQMPQAPSGTSGSPFISQFKVCVCMPSGKLFRVAVHAGQSSHTACMRTNMAQHIDPCKLS
uniref:Beta-sarcoglycan n=1 Tax=Homalodisca liturata TaxID=320908 RepID=A0A1B6H5D8_9HEMI